MSVITLKGIIDEDFVNYRVPSMSLMFPTCTFKCGKNNCQNKTLIKQRDIAVDLESLGKRYIRNPITNAIVLQGMEPFDSFDDALILVDHIRCRLLCNDDIVIYSGYNQTEISGELYLLRQFKNIVVKYGRYLPGYEPHFDEVLGVKLASPNQYAERIS